MASVRIAQILLPRYPGAVHRVFWTMLACLLLLSGCVATSPVVVEKPLSPSAHLAVLNLTDYEWHIVIVRSSGGSAADFHLEPRGSHSVDLVGDNYSIEQTTLSEAAAPELSRKIPATLEAGQSYRWRLVTLLSEQRGSSDSP